MNVYKPLFLLCLSASIISRTFTVGDKLHFGTVKHHHTKCKYNRSDSFYTITYGQFQYVPGGETDSSRYLTFCYI